MKAKGNVVQAEVGARNWPVVGHPTNPPALRSSVLAYPGDGRLPVDPEAVRAQGRHSGSVGQRRPRPDGTVVRCVLDEDPGRRGRVAGYARRWGGELWVGYGEV